MNEDRYLTVSSLNRYISYRFETDIHLQTVLLRGEVTNFKKTNRHMYFTLKDEESEISAMVFYPISEQVTFEIRNGMVVKCQGRVQVYEKKGNYAIIIQKIEDDGIGLLYQQYLALLDKLAKEGLFDDAKKLPLPEYPRHIAIVTSATGEAINDIISTFKKRFTTANIRLYPALVQGVDAPRDLIRAVNEVYSDSLTFPIDALIIGRGGGSYEDLACFNDEGLARLLAKAPFAVVSAVGHEGDFTICDFVASYRAPTPTGAAVALSKERRDVVRQIEQLLQRLKSSMIANLHRHFVKYDSLVTSYGLAQFSDILKIYSLQYENKLNLLKQLSPLKQYEAKQTEISQLSSRLISSTKRLLTNYENDYNQLIKQDIFQLFTKYISGADELVTNYSKSIFSAASNYMQHVTSRLGHLIEKNALLNPLNLMSKGYSVVYQEGIIKASISSLDITKPLQIRMQDGEVNALIITKNLDNEKDEENNERKDI